MQQSVDPAEFLPCLEEVARRAGDIAMRYFRSGERTSAQVHYKGGGSPVTDADLAVDRFLFEETRKLAPQTAWISEETKDDPARLSSASVIVVDPIDGTTAFARGDHRWAVSIALVENGRPVVGVVHAPAKAETFVAARGLGTQLNGARLETSQREKLDRARLVAPKGVQERAARLGFSIAPRSPSLALRLVDLAAGRHDIVVAAPNARDWDIAAADIILEEAGAVLSEPDGAKLTYNRASLARRMLVAAPKSLLAETLALTRAVSQEGR